MALNRLIVKLLNIFPPQHRGAILFVVLFPLPATAALPFLGNAYVSCSVISLWIGAAALTICAPYFDSLRQADAESECCAASSATNKILLLQLQMLEQGVLKDSVKGCLSKPINVPQKRLAELFDSLLQCK